MSLETICFWIFEMKYSFKTPLGTDVIKKQFKSTEVICYDYLAIIKKKQVF